MFILDSGQQCFCGNDQCRIMAWDCTKTLDELAKDANWIDWPPR